MLGGGEDASQEDRGKGSFVGGVYLSEGFAVKGQLVRNRLEGRGRKHKPKRKQESRRWCWWWAWEGVCHGFPHSA